MAVFSIATLKQIIHRASLAVKIAFVSTLAFAFIGLFVIADGAYVSTKRLALEKTVFVENSERAEVHSLATTKDDGFVLAGKIGDAISVNEAWATRVDRDGHALWVHHKPPVDMPPYTLRPSPQPIYNAAVVMPDDSVFLCGQMQRDVKPGSRLLVAQGVLTHLDKSGKVINDLDLSPKVDGVPISAKLRSCLAFGDGIFAVGAATKMWPDPQGAARGGPAYVGRDFLWAIYLSPDGSIRWERLVPLEAEPKRHTMTVFGRGDAQALLTRDNRVAVFTEAGTEGYLFSQDGSVITRRIGTRSRWDESFQPIALQDGTFSSTALSAVRFVRGLQIDRGGAYYKNADYNYVEFSSELIETRRTPMVQAMGGEPRFRYRLSDGSLLYFGVTRLGRHVASAHAQLLGPEPTSNETLRLGDKGYSYHVDAVAPADTPGAFVAARYSRRPSGWFPPLYFIDDYLYQMTPHGVALDFIRVELKQ